jgi:hypothetical protein
VALYIYRVGWTYPAKNSFTDLNLQKVLIVFGLQIDRYDRSDPPVRPVGIFRSAARSRPVRPLTGTGQTGLFDLCQFWSSTYASLFFGDASMPKKQASESKLSKDDNKHASAIFCSKGDKFYHPYLASSST